MLRFPLMRTGRALGQFPFVAEQVPEEVVAPLGWRRGPDDFQAAADRVTAFATAIGVLPAEALRLDGGERILKITVAAVALVRQPLAFGAPVDVSSGSQTSARPPPKPNVLNPID